ncbi:MAG: hypothetical protein AABX85_03995 [Nanoarchaeota archaeon]|mgnify:CR=1 FL=1
MNRKGDVQVSIIVLMSLVICVFALFNFYTHFGKIKTEVADASFIDKVYAEEYGLKTSMFFMVKSKFIEEYSNVDLSTEDYEATEKNIKDSMDNLYLTSRLNKDEKKKLNIELNDNFISASLDEIVLSGSVMLKDKRRVWFWGIVPVSSSYDQVNTFVAAIYRKKIKIDIDIEKEGLHGFRQINSALESCEMFDTKKEIEDCLQKRLVNFDIVVNVVIDGNGAIIDKSVEMKSKRVFSIDGQLKNIEFKTTLA